MARVDELLGQVEHLRDVLGGAGEDVGREEVEERGVGVERGLVRVGDLGWVVLCSSPAATSIRSSPRSKRSSRRWPTSVMFWTWRTVDAVVQHRPSDEVGEEERPQVADVGVAVDGRAAGVHPEAPAVGRLDGFDGAGEGVAEAERHRRIVVGRTRDPVEISVESP